MNAPATVEGREVWRLARDLAGQMRYTPRGVATGWDMAGALALAAARGILPAAAELLPAAEMGLRAGVADLLAREEANDRAEDTDA